MQHKKATHLKLIFPNKTEELSLTSLGTHSLHSARVPSWSVTLLFHWIGATQVQGQAVRSSWSFTHSTQNGGRRSNKSTWPRVFEVSLGCLKCPIGIIIRESQHLWNCYSILLLSRQAQRGEGLHETLYCCWVAGAVCATLHLPHWGIWVASREMMPGFSILQLFPQWRLLLLVSRWKHWNMETSGVALFRFLLPGCEQNFSRVLGRS